MKQIKISPKNNIQATVSVPGSKSISNRALAIAALADGDTILRNILFSDDTKYMMKALKKIGLKIKIDKKNNIVKIRGGIKNFKPFKKSLYIGNAGTAIRFLTALLTLTKNSYCLTGNDRMQERPIGDLLTALNALGGLTTSQVKEGYPPVIIEGKTLRGGEITIPGETSSQFTSATLLVAPFTKQETRINISGNPVSIPYLKMTTSMMLQFGVITLTQRDNKKYTIKNNQQYIPQDYTIESDASSASYFFAAAAITGGKVTVNNISFDSLQGDIQFARLLKKMGCSVSESNNSITVQGSDRLKGIEVNMSDISDTAPTLAVTALFASSPTTIRGVANMRVKECDRISALKTELTKLGANIEEFPDGLKISPNNNYNGATLETYDDHRMAMSLALAGLIIPEVIILDPDCCAKTFPTFFKIFLNLGEQNA